MLVMTCEMIVSIEDTILVDDEILHTQGKREIIMINCMLCHSFVKYSGADAWPLALLFSS